MSDAVPGPESTRRSKTLGIEEAVSALVPAECESLWIGGMHMHNVPMALVREWIRQGKRIHTLYAAPSSSLAADLLIGAGLVRRIVVGYLGFEHLGLAPAFRRIVEGGENSPELVEADSGSLTIALQAGAWGQQFAPLPPGIELTSLPTTSPGLYRTLTDPFTGNAVTVVRAVRPQVALIHCQQADEYGNGVSRGSMFVDRLLAFAADTVLLQVEALAPAEQTIKQPHQTSIPGFRVAGVCQVNFGCHPTSSHRYYNYDDVHLRLYMKAASSSAGFAEYLRHFVFEPESQEEYMRRVQRQSWEELDEEE